jgi:hypothetical protein
MSEKYKSTGTITALFDTKQVSDKFRKREFVIEIPDGKYPQSVLFQLTGDRCSALDEFSIGDEVAVEWNLRGRKWTSNSGEDKYFVSCDAWKITRVGAAKSKPAGASDVQAAFGGGPDDDSIPF